MNSQDKLIKYFQKFISLTSEEQNQLYSCFQEIKIKKRQFIVQPTFVGKHRNFILKGAFRAYVVSNEGEEHTIQFAIENWWISDFNSYIYQQPATMFIVALEDSIVLQLDFAKEQELKKSNHKFETFFRIMAEKGLAFEHRRITLNHTLTAQERYENFIANFQHIAQRVPQYALASYLGMTREFLSKIRNKRVTQKK
jgi:CRP-like cAMP-binding protein